MLLKQQILTIILLAISSTIITAQELLWEKDLKEALYNVSWIEQSDDGVIIAAGDKALMGLDNNTGEVLWENKQLKAIDRNGFQKIDGLPIFSIESTSLMGSTKSVIMNSSSGEIVFDSKEENLKFGQYHILPKIASILFEVKQEANNKLLLFNYETSQISWLSDLGPATKGVKGLIKRSYRGFTFLNFDPVIMDNSRMLVGEGKKISVIEYNTGKILWSSSFKKGLKAIAYSPVDKKVYVGIKEKLQVFDAASGKDVTAGKMKLGGSLESIFSNSDNNIVIVDSKGFNILNAQTGNFLWKKPFGIDGLYDVIEMEDNYIAIGSEEKSSTIAKVSKNGKKIWKEKLDGFAYHVQPIDKGIFYLSTEKSNILTYEEGDKVWRKDIKFKAIPAVTVDQKNQEVVFYEGKELYRFNLKTGEIETLAEGLKFEKSKDAIFQLENRANSYFLYSDQHVASFTKEGKVLYNTYHKPVSSLGLNSILRLTASVGGIDLDIAGSLETIAELDALAHGSVMTTGDQNESGSLTSSIGGLYVEDIKGQSHPILEVTKTRFFNSKKTKDHNYILTNQSGKNQIIMVNKDSGQIDKTIPLDDKTPNYVTDEIDQRVFINEKNRTVRCYQMN